MNTITYNNNTIYPSKVVCIGRNYVEHIAELGNEIPKQAVIFCKPNSAISNHLYCGVNEPIHYETELSFLVKDGKIYAVGIGLDLTKRELQSQLKANGLPWERAKSFDKAAVFSDFVDFNMDFENLSLQLFINGKLIQQANYKQMMLKPLQVLSEIQSFMSISDGDIIMTGTPKGVGEIKQGDVFLTKIYLGKTLLIEKEWKVG